LSLEKKGDAMRILVITIIAAMAWTYVAAGETVAVPGEVIQCAECHGEGFLRRHLPTISRTAELAARDDEGYKRILRLHSDDMPFVRCICPSCGGVGKKIKVANSIVKMPPPSSINQLKRDCELEEARARLELRKMALAKIQRDVDDAQKEVDALSPKETSKENSDKPTKQVIKGELVNPNNNPVDPRESF